MTQHEHLTRARVEANATYQRRRARTAVDTLLEIRPDLWDDHTRHVILEVLPRSIRRYDTAMAVLEAAWCSVSMAGGLECGLPEGHAGDHDPFPPGGRCEHGYAPAVCGQCHPAPGIGALHSRTFDDVHDNGDYRA
jgi:hypothetical protein